MSDQALDLRRSLHIVRRRWIIVAAAAAIGVAGGLGYAVLNPPKLTSTANVLLAAPTPVSPQNSPAAQVFVAGSQPVLAQARLHIQPSMSVRDLQHAVNVKSQADSILSVSAQGRTATQASTIANAVANSYVAFISSPAYRSSSSNPNNPLRATLFEPATGATGRPLSVFMIFTGVIGVLLGLLIGVLSALAVSRRDRRLRQRDDIADSIGIPVLASVTVSRPSDAAGWVKLLTEYEPAPVDAWHLRGALHQLVLGDAAGGDQSTGASLAVITLSSDPRALALGPQLAVFTASLGIRTQLVVGPQQDPNVTATLRSACTGMADVKASWSRYLSVAVRDGDSGRAQGKAALTITVSVVDQRSPKVADRMRTTATVLGVSAGTATAEDLARVAVSAADDGRQIAGILVADPDPTDHTTGRRPEPARTTARQPSHLTGIPTETRRWMNQTRRSR
jgi:capsular polysaccharide biosynthesis protein